MGHARPSAGTRGTLLGNTGCRSTLQEAARLTGKPSTSLPKALPNRLCPPCASRRARWMVMTATIGEQSTRRSNSQHNFGPRSKHLAPRGSAEHQLQQRSLWVDRNLLTASRSHRNLPYALVRCHASAVEARSHVPGGSGILRLREPKWKLSCSSCSRFEERPEDSTLGQGTRWSQAPGR